MTAETQISEIERCALTILSQGVSQQHPMLAEYIERLVAGEHVDCARYEPSEQVLDMTRQWAEDDNWGNGPAILMPIAGRDALTYKPQGYDLLKTALERRLYPRPERDTAEYATWKVRSDEDAALMRLAAAVESFRYQGRPAGDYTADLWRDGEDDAIVVETSLAAAIAEYANRIRGIVWEVVD